MKRVLTLVAVCIVVAVFAAFTMPTKKLVKSEPVGTKTAAKDQTTGGFAFDPKD